MNRIRTMAILAAAAACSLPLAACKDTKTLQANDQLKAQVADLQKQNGEMGNNLETVTAARDALEKQNESLQVEIQSLKSGKKNKKKVSSKRHHHGPATSKASASWYPVGALELREPVANSSSKSGGERHEIV
jgi:lysozyme family protein